MIWTWVTNAVREAFPTSICKKKIIIMIIISKKKKKRKKNAVPPERIELSTPGLQDQCSATEL